MIGEKGSYVESLSLGLRHANRAGMSNCCPIILNSRFLNVEKSCLYAKILFG